LLLGNGSHELLMQFAQVFAGEGDEVVASQYGFAVYALAAQAAGATLVQAPALPRPRCDGPRPLTSTRWPPPSRRAPSSSISPTQQSRPAPGSAWTALRAFLARVPRNVIVVVDEAYAEFNVRQAPRSHSLHATRTSSSPAPSARRYALRGLRIGFASAIRA
jgi:histidinol-phosphate aminotransferase